jgi:hypothetical protein
VLVLREAERGASSPVAGYIAQLPPTMDCPLLWGEGEVAALQYRPVIEAVAVQKVAWEGYYRQLAAALQGGRQVPYPRFVWAMENVRSRAFSGPYTGSSLRDKAAGAAVLAAAGGAYILTQHVALEQVST